jgi:hypothetical protein
MLTAPELAGFCNVDVKTIHNWVGKSQIVAHKTQGGHLRFSPIVVVDFLRLHGYPIARALRDRKPEVLVCLKRGPVLELATKALGKRFSLRVHPSVIEALWLHVCDAVEAIVTDPGDDPLFSVIEPKLRELRPSLRIVYFTRDSNATAEVRAGILAATHAAPGQLRAILEESLATRA